MELKTDKTDEEFILDAKKDYIKDVTERLKTIDIDIKNQIIKKNDLLEEISKKEEEFKEEYRINKEKGERYERCNKILRGIDPKDFFLKKSLVNYMNKNTPKLISTRLLYEEKVSSIDDIIKKLEKNKKEFLDEIINNEIN